MFNYLFLSAMAVVFPGVASAATTSVTAEKRTAKPVAKAGIDRRREEMLAEKHIVRKQRVGFDFNLYVGSFSKTESTVVAPGYKLQNPNDAVEPYIRFTDPLRASIGYDYNLGHTSIGVGLHTITTGPTNGSWYEIRGRGAWWFGQVFKGAYVGGSAGVGTMLADKSRIGSSYYIGSSGGYVFSIRKGIDITAGSDLGYVSASYSMNHLDTTTAWIEFAVKGGAGFSF